MEELLFQCPTCGVIVSPPEEGWSLICPSCQRRVDLTGQFAYVRAYEAYEEAGETMEELKTYHQRGLSRFEYARREQEAYMIFGEAYSALQEAFRYELSGKQHEHSVKMAANMANLFLPRGLMSDLEATYWHALMFEQTASVELRALEDQMNSPVSGSLGFVKRWRWKMRQRVLKRSLVEIDRKIRRLESGMGLVHHMHAYKGLSIRE
jgi:hypothetical protein